MVHRALTQEGLPRYLRIYKLTRRNHYRLVFVGRYPERKKSKYRWVAEVDLVFGRPRWMWSKERCCPLPKPDLALADVPNRTVRESMLLAYLSLWGLAPGYKLNKDTLLIGRRSG